MWRHLSIAVVAHKTVVQRVRSNRWRFNFEMAGRGGQINFLWKTAMIITITKTSILIICPFPWGLLLTYPLSPPPTWVQVFKNSTLSWKKRWLQNYAWNVITSEHYINKFETFVPSMSSQSNLHRIVRSIFHVWLYWYLFSTRCAINPGLLLPTKLGSIRLEKNRRFHNLLQCGQSLSSIKALWRYIFVLEYLLFVEII